MIEQQGRVVSVADGTAEVCLGASAGCARCDSGRGCGAGIFGRLFKRKPVTISMENTAGARPGQSVMVGIPEALFLGLVARLYLIPLLSGVAGAVAGHYLSVLAGLGSAGSDAMTLLCACALGMAALMRTRTGRGEFSGSFIVHLLRVIETREPGN